MIDNIPGVNMVRPGDLISIEIHDRTDPQNGVFYETLYRPTNYEIFDMCKRYDFDYTFTMNLIRNRDPLVYAIMIDVEKYREYLKGEKE